MSKLRFGTDGIRGVANRDLSPDFALKLGRATGRYIVEHGLPRSIIMGRDTRRSGAMLGASFAAGACSVGVQVHSVGIAPTGAISWLTRHRGDAFGVVISASHNPAPDNGIKFFQGNGSKASAESESWIMAHLDDEVDLQPGDGVGFLSTGPTPLEEYESWLVGLVPERLDGMKIVMDCADGAAFEVAPRVFAALGADLTILNQEPNGDNINSRGGATKPHIAQDRAKKESSVAVSFDGDADRAVFSDENGNLINGDRTMAAWAAHWSDDGALSPPTVVGTVMSNGGFATFLEEQGITLYRANVGDKYVSRLMHETGARIGGEQSGHIIFSSHGPTGDGLVTALEFLRVLRRTGKPASDFSGAFANYPQILVNVEVERRDGWDSDESVRDALTEAEVALKAAKGRLNVRPSGTQPMIRVMVEAEDRPLAEQTADHLAAVLIASRGGEVAGRVDLTDALGD
ncbi:MAG: phosphoglucosamine mutase [Fimbriimonadaceae bacterium]|nr:phosphoglucosamine mutase [Fimbriimonadaceae bacterium]